MSCVLTLACNALVGLPAVDPPDAGSSHSDPPLPDGAVEAEAGAQDANGETHPCDLATVSSDSLHCGWCGHSCGGTACQSGMCVPSRLTTPSESYQGRYSLLVVDDDDVLFADWCKGAPVYRAASGIASPIGVAGCGGSLVRDGNRVFYMNVARTSNPITSDLLSFDIHGTATTPVLTDMQDWVTSTAIDSTSFYYAYGEGGQHGIVRLDRNAAGNIDPGATRTALLETAAQSFVLVGDRIYLVGDKKVQSVSKNGPPATTLYTFQNDLTDLATDGTALYWLEVKTRTVYRGALDGSESTIVATSLSDDPRYVAADGKSVYFGVGQSLQAANNDGTRRRVYAEWNVEHGTANDDVVTSIAMSNGYVYWGRGVQPEASLWRVPR